jgi:hypothetical protein
MDSQNNRFVATGDKLDTNEYPNPPDNHAHPVSADADLEERIRRHISTRFVEQPPEGLNTPRWGTALLDDKTSIMFQVTGYQNPVTASLSPQGVIVGRTFGDITVDVDLTPFDAADKGVSRKHAGIYTEEDMLKVVDLESTNGTYLNGSRLTPFQPRILRNGDELRLGKLVLIVLLA